jgi:hypothetical protein
MKKLNLKIIFIFFIFNIFFFSKSQSNIDGTIIVKVGSEIITSIDIQNEIITNLIIDKREITQQNINDNKNFAVKNLITKAIKKAEIDKFQIKNYNKVDLRKYIDDVAKNLNTNSDGLKEIFKQKNIYYQAFKEKQEIELLWNTLIFSLYRNQTNVNIVEIDNEVEKIKENKSPDELKKVKERILNQRKQEKLELFSRSHFSNLENSIVINFQ